ncbi:ribonuclease H-like domain-containing protein [Xylariaceae sp. FL0255]|nr:ribonuclease H-like domain-containing protein [Xylariaceae sp. FL0255]
MASYPASPNQGMGRGKSSVEQRPKDEKCPRGIFPLRPGPTNIGDRSKLLSNHFKLVTGSTFEFHRYSIEIVDKATRENIVKGNAIEDKEARENSSREKKLAARKAKRVVQLFLNKHFPPNRQIIATDFISNIISPRKIENIKEEYIVNYFSEYDSPDGPSRKEYTVKITPIGSVSLRGPLGSFNNSLLAQGAPKKEEIIQALNIIIGHHPKSNEGVITKGGNQHFSKSPAHYLKKPLTGGLFAFKGFFSSARAAQQDILVNVQPRVATVYQSGRLDRLMMAYKEKSIGDYTEDDMRGLLKFLNNLSVKTDHVYKKNSAGKRLKITQFQSVQRFADQDDGKNSSHKISKFGAGAKEAEFRWDQSEDEAKTGSRGNKTTKSTESRGDLISVFDYFREKYPGARIENPDWPVINVKAKTSPSYLPPSLCLVQPGRFARVRINENQRGNLIQLAVTQPSHNKGLIKGPGRELLGFNSENKTLKAFNLEVDTDFVEVEGRILPQPQIKYRGNKRISPAPKWDLKGVKLVKTEAFKKWLSLRISLAGQEQFWGDENDFKVSVSAFALALSTLGIKLEAQSRGAEIQIRGDLTSIFPKIDTSIETFANRFTDTTEKFLLIVIPEKAPTSIYHRVKFMCDVERGIKNICVRDKKFSQNDLKFRIPYLANVGLKLNLKHKGINHELETGDLGYITSEKTMVVRIDVTHPSPDSSAEVPSIAGMVASIDSSLGQWPVILTLQKGGQEMVANLEGMFMSRLEMWKLKNMQKLPDNILIYRDGVSEGQYNMVRDEELRAIRAACKSMYFCDASEEEKCPRITVVVVGKRHNTRFYPREDEYGDGKGNPKNGTVVDQGVTDGHNWDFFLQPHTALKGTVRPAHYYVVYDQIFSRSPTTAANDLVKLTHNMCHLYGRTTGPVSICPPVFYADLACGRARCYPSGVLNLSLPADSPTSFGPGKLEEYTVKIHPDIKDTMFYI